MKLRERELQSSYGGSVLGPDITEPFLRAGSYGLAVHTPRGRVTSALTHCAFRPTRIPSPPALALCSNYNFLFLIMDLGTPAGMAGGTPRRFKIPY